MTLKKFFSNAATILATTLLFVPQLQAHDPGRQAVGIIILGIIFSKAILMIIALPIVLISTLGKKGIKHILVIIVGIILSIFIPWIMINQTRIFSEKILILILYISIPILQSIFWYTWFGNYGKKAVKPLIITTFILTILVPALFIVGLIFFIQIGVLR